MSKCYFTRKAVEDLTEIWHYTFHHWSEEQADKYYDLIVTACNELADKPQKGKNYDIISQGVLVTNPLNISSFTLLFQKMKLRSSESCTV